jgi:glycosyltransferase involved in cell wall biosynthesis
MGEQLHVLFDARDEGWPSMDLAGEMLVRGLEALGRFAVHPLRPSLPRVGRRLAATRTTHNLDRVFGRYLLYPLRARGLPRGALFHIVDHSYAQLVHALPAERTGVYLHDLDTFAPMLGVPSTPVLEALSRLTLRGLQRARRVFVSTEVMRSEVARLRLIPEERLVLAPLGVAPEFRPDEAGGRLPTGVRPPYVLHVGSGSPRKRLDVLLEAFARAAARHPTLQLVQLGAALGPAERAQLDRLGLGARLVQPPSLDRAALATLYRQAIALLLPSDREGFGLPVIEALACGTAVIASDLPTIREVGADAVTLCAPGNAAAFGAALERAFEAPGELPGRERRLDRAAHFSWATHARIVSRTYEELL